MVLIAVAILVFWAWVSLFAIAAPIIVTYRENTEERVSRKRFAMWLIAAWAMWIIFVSTVNGPLSYLSILVYMWTGLSAQQALVRRARDAGLGKTIAYYALIPIVSAPICLYLLCKRPILMPGSSVDEAP